ncbi:MAG: polyprenol monophosphomannose synthase [Chloroflexota bacterium]
MTHSATCVIVPTYNEAENLDELLEQLLALPLALSVIVVDDNSPDGSGRLADQWAGHHPERVRVIHRPRKLGLGTAYLAGFELALRDAAVRQVITMDADLSHRPHYIPALLQMGRQMHVVIGSRYVPGGGHHHWGWTRMALSRTANFITHLALGLVARDTTAGFRLYRREVLESIPLAAVQSSGYAFQIEMLFLCQRRGWRIGELPIIFEERQRGQTKLSRQELLLAQETVLRLLWRRLKGVEPQRPAAEVGDWRWEVGD